MMPNVIERTTQGLVKVLHAVKLIVVAVICLLIGMTARQLFDAYGREMVPLLREERVEAEMYEVDLPQQEIPLPRKPADPSWNR